MITCTKVTTHHAGFTNNIGTVVKVVGIRTTHNNTATRHRRDTPPAMNQGFSCRPDIAATKGTMVGTVMADIPMVEAHRGTAIHEVISMSGHFTSDGN